MDPHEEYFRSLRKEEVHLIALKEYLYEGSWEEMARDLDARRQGKPFVFKLETRIEEDLDRIRKLLDYEKRTGVNLGEYLHLLEKSRTD